nr:uncharacterized protein LOC111374798 [Ipomoea trifida]
MKSSAHRKAKSWAAFRPNLELEESDDDNLYQYTSLRDIMAQERGSAAEGSSAFDSSTISIRNSLVKHAASAYVQSATIVAPRDPDWVVAGVWGKVKNGFVGCTSCWHAHVRIHFHAFFTTAIRFLDCLVNTITRAF